jgi:hypothetical protein
MAVRTKNSLDYTIIPVWDFYGKEVMHYNHDDVNAFNRENPRGDWSYPYDMDSDLYYYEYLTLNAIDGSVINRVLGY